MNLQTTLAVLEMNPHEAGGAAPEWIRLVPRGPFTITKGDTTLELRADDASYRQILRNRAARGVDHVLDFNHQTLYRGAKAPAAGWVKELEAREDGLWGRMDWTEDGAADVVGKRFRYVSPVLRHTTDGHVRDLLHAALTNIPAINHQDALAADALDTEPTMNHRLILTSLLALDASASDADIEAAASACKARGEKLLGVLALDATATEDQVTAALDRLAAEAKTAGDVAQALGVQDRAKLVTTALDLQANRAAQVDPKEFERMRQQLAATRAECIVTTALDAGKVAPASEQWLRDFVATNPDQAEAWLKDAPVIVPLDSRGPTAPAVVASRSSADREVGSALGVSDETWKRFNH